MTETSSAAEKATPVPGSAGSLPLIGPLLETSKLIKKMGAYTTKKMAAAGGAPVFRAHPGFSTVVLTDHVSSRFFCTASEEYLEREPEQRFGPVAPRQELIRGCPAALITSGAVHARSRPFADAVVASRASTFLSTFESVTVPSFSDWVERGSMRLDDGVARLTSAFVYQWILGVQPDPADVALWRASIPKVETDSTVSNLAARLLPPKMGKGAVAASERLTELARSSPYFEEYVEIAARYGFTDAGDIARQLVFLCNFNMHGGMTRFMIPGLASISTNGRARARLVDELDDWSGALDTVDGLEYLDGVYHECLRLYPAPRFIHKRAMSDFALPARNGASYQIRRGDLVMCLVAYANRDATVFDDPTSFVPERFTETPALRDEILTFGRASGAEHSYGCAGSAIAPRLWKLLIAYMVKHYDWTIGDVRFSLDNENDVEPPDAVLADFGLRRGSPA